MTDPAPPADSPRAGPLLATETWVFDLDNTLYPASCDLFSQVDRRMKAFIADYLSVPEDEAFRIQKQYFRDHGTTLRGLMTHHGMAPDPFLDYVHDIDLSAVAPNPALDRALAALPGRKVIFTNASVAHAERVMDRLGVTGRFDGLFDIHAADFEPKPRPAVYDRMVAALGIEPTRAVMVEDIARNLEPAAALGMVTVWVRTDSHWGLDGADGDWVHHATDDLTAWLQGVLDGAP
ncbi:MAG: pyrimidine 5'-nucleotidase [Rhodobacterales bacterium]|nr:pyrimidine 5'-nucleotidase [Rhodobacterales bacterium]